MPSRIPNLCGAVLLACAALLLGARGAHAVTIVTFSGLTHGRVVDVDFAAQGISQIITTNFNGPDLGVIFDTTRTGTADPDLEDAWDGGNLPGSTVLGNILIIQENNWGCADDVCDSPDDEGDRPAGTFDIRLSTPIAGFGFDLVDLESETAEGGSITYYDGVTSVTRTWSQLMAADPTLVWGDNYLNRLAVTQAASLGLTQIDRVLITLGGSGGIDNLVLDDEFPPTPEPAGLAGLGAVLALAAARRRARRR